MDSRKKAGLVLISVPLVAMLGYCSNQDYKLPTKEERQKAIAEEIKKLESEEALKEFEVRPIQVDPFGIVIGSIFLCRGKAAKLRPEYSVLGPDAEKLNEIKDSKGDHFFSCEDIAKYIGYGGTVEYAQKLASLKDEKGNNLFYGAQLPQLAALNLSVDELINFKDTEKPNALFVYPTSDINDEDKEGAFRTSSAVKFFNRIKKEYDVKAVVASREEEVYNAIKPEYGFKLLVLTGHGSKNTLQLGACDNLDDKCEIEKHIIDTNDFDFSIPLNNLHKEAVIFLNSCSTAEGREDIFNLANTIHMFSYRRKVIGSEVPFAQGHLDVKSSYPFDVQIKVKNVDKTYVVESDNNQNENYGVINLEAIVLSKPFSK
ncbi:MAG: hypothetical protein KKA62_06110 [Nanoarchaeota archaeon]|nr:hypothetical protein [Nanoarchaeota archaeon]MBU1644417.1 hypothetical protein [Nanoarchaeota archaeon]MBU1977499.1 hypothetical protein [Nanoarchaeota archaeon]